MPVALVQENLPKDKSIISKGHSFVENSGDTNFSTWPYLLYQVRLNNIWTITYLDYDIKKRPGRYYAMQVEEGLDLLHDDSKHMLFGQRNSFLQCTCSHDTDVMSRRNYLLMLMVFTYPCRSEGIHSSQEGVLVIASSFHQGHRGHDNIGGAEAMPIAKRRDKGPAHQSIESIFLSFGREYIYDPRTKFKVHSREALLALGQREAQLCEKFGQPLATVQTPNPELRGCVESMLEIYPQWNILQFRRRLTITEHFPPASFHKCSTACRVRDKDHCQRRSSCSSLPELPLPLDC